MAIVCDGMGGHQGGDVASTMAVSHLGHNFMTTDLTDKRLAKKWLDVQLRAENETILKAADRFPDLNGMGTTIVLAIFFEKMFCWLTWATPGLMFTLKATLSS